VVAAVVTTSAALLVIQAVQVAVPNLLQMERHQVQPLPHQGKAMLEVADQPITLLIAHLVAVVAQVQLVEMEAAQHRLQATAVMELALIHLGVQQLE
jgi:hypothetical protein